MSDSWTKARSSLRPGQDSAGDSDRDYSLEDRMRLLNVPAVSVAIIDQGRITIETGVGQLAADDPTRVTSKTVFAACSVSKAATAMAALRLVDAGKLPLDADVNDHVKDWQLNDATGKRAKVSLRQILTHTGGINIHGGDAYAAAEVPTLEQVFRGQPPCMSAPVHVFCTPGSRYEYSSGGYIFLQQMICDATGQSFEEAMAALVFKPLAMEDSTFASDARGMPRAAAHVSLVRKASPETSLVWPALAPTGLWTTAGDLARLILAIQRSYTGDGDFLSKSIVQEALRRQTPHNDIGLGVYLMGNEGPSRRFNHLGGYFGYQAEINGWLAGGQGYAVMTNNGYTGTPLKSELLKALQKAYLWPT